MGKLIPQFPIHAGFSGERNDTVGPLDYNPKIEFAKFHKPPVTQFSKDQSNYLKQELRRAASNPGPGSYNTLSSFDLLDHKSHNKEVDFINRLHDARKHKHAVFASKTERDVMKPQNDTPGPGRYNIPSSIKVTEPSPPVKQTFASSGPRFQDVSYPSLFLHTYLYILLLVVIVTSMDVCVVCCSINATYTSTRILPSCDVRL